MRRSPSNVAVALCIALLFGSCDGGGGGSNPAPTPSPIRRANLSATASGSATRTSAAINYRVPTTFTDSGGVASSLTSADITFFAGSQNLGTSRVDHSSPGNTVRVPANGAMSIVYTFSDDDFSRPVVTRLEFRNSYTDDSGGTGVVSFSADITPPAGPPPPPPGSATLTGSVRTGSTFLSDALVEVRTGSSAGRSTRTDGNGHYTLGSLVTGTFSVRASKDGYNASEKQTTVSTTGTLDFDLTRASGGGGGGGGGGGAPPSSANPLPPRNSDRICDGAFAPSVASCVDNRVEKPSAICNNGRYSCADNRQGQCSGGNDGVYCWFCPGKLCNGNSAGIVTSSLVPDPDWLMPATRPKVWSVAVEH